MKMEWFENVVDRQMEMCKDVLYAKSKEYSTEEDKLHNFKNAAGMMGCDPKAALAGMMAKHTISIYDMCHNGKSYDIGIWQEKITDHINYLLLLKALVIEEIEERMDAEEDPWEPLKKVAAENGYSIPEGLSNADDTPHSVTYEMKGEKV